MTPDLRARLASLGLTQAAASRLLGVRTSTMQRWVKGERPVPPHVLLLLGLLRLPEAREIAERAAEDRKHIEGTKP
jgi:transcriptional regulator with XRE-family HTH domain